MDYEKKYKEALERARKLYNEAKANEYTSDMEDYEAIFPELADSDDERIRKEIIHFLEVESGQMTPEQFFKSEDKWIPWLEKQKPIECSLEQAAEIFLDSLAKTPYNNKPVTDAQIITKQLLNFLQNSVSYNPDALIADEQKPFDNENANIQHKDFAPKEEPKFRIGKWIIRSTEGFKHDVYLVTEVKDYYVCEDLKGRRVTFTFNDVHKNFKLWDITDAKDGDVLFTKEYEEPKIVFILKGRVPKDCVCRYYCYYNIMYPYFATDEVKGCLAPKCADLTPATKEQRDVLFQKIKEAGYEWYSEKKGLRKIEKQKPVEWREEDDKMLQTLVLGVGDYTLFSGIPSEDIVNWLKSLKQRFKEE